MGCYTYHLRTEEHWEYIFPEGHQWNSNYAPSFWSAPHHPQAPASDAKVSKEAGKSKEAQPSVKAKHSEDTLTIRDVVSQAKDAKLKSKAGDSQSEKADPKKDPPQA